ncbi:hypothetical protein GAO09_26690 [Rhizobiales bacterium RZME27]|uniref:Uncharacterized protein n=1 Tax=Endobacterium cereale TaxID=2663029 RepID=A0A6A8AID3_9HYPH|nr:hypothetical protein [Endobacterium cereale]MEB2843127.1 hypothetical protein [Endobacterium cereale]MQY49618.1 hypothetical protein [Endobacterium cereale]
MNKRTLLYVALMVSLMIGAIIDAYIFAYNERLLILNDITQMILIITFFALWEIEDAKMRDVPYKRSARILTVLFAPLGLLVYCLQSRRPLPAVILYVGFMIGVVAAIGVGSVIGELLVTGSLERLYSSEG